MEFIKEITPREYQKQIFQTCKEKNCLIVLPTGLGKTLIAMMLSVHRMKEFPGKKVVFLAPTKPLAEQHLQTFTKHLPELFGDFQLFTGEVKPEERKRIWRTADIIFSTPQCVANDLKKNLYDLSEVCLLIEDEAHRCVRNYDYTYLSKQYLAQSHNPRIIGMTASPGSDYSKIKEICKNLSIEEVELRTRQSSDVRDYLQELEFEKVTVEFPKEFEEIRYALNKILEQYIEELRFRGVLHGPANKLSLIELQKKISAVLSRGNKNFNYFWGASACAQAIRIQHAIELLETQTLSGLNKYLDGFLEQAKKTQNRGIIKLTKKSEFRFLHSRTKELIEKKHEHPKLKKVNDILKSEFEKNQNFKAIVFTQFRDTANTLLKNFQETESIKAKIFIGQATKKDSSGKITLKGLSQKEQKQIISEFAEGKINLLCATSIGEEGLDIPEVNAVIFYEPIPSAIRTIQRSGRTARLNKGKIIILITKKTRDESFFYVSRSKEKKMKKIIEDIKKNLGKKTENQKTL